MNELLDPAIKAKVVELTELAKKYSVDYEVVDRGIFGAIVKFHQVTRHGYYTRMSSYLSFTDTGKVRVKSAWYQGRKTENVAAKHIEESLEFLAKLNDEARAKMWA